MNPVRTTVQKAINVLTAKVVCEAAFLASVLKSMTLSLFYALARFCKLRIADDLRRLTQDGLRCSKALGDSEEAKARKLHAEASKTEAEAAAILMNAESERIRALSEAWAKLAATSEREISPQGQTERA